MTLEETVVERPPLEVINARKLLRLGANARKTTDGMGRTVTVVELPPAYRKCQGYYGGAVKAALPEDQPDVDPSRN